MGCDIHPFVEYVAFETEEGPYWSCLMSGFGDRNYDWFSVLADCGRNGEPPLFPNRGLPEGKMSFTTERAMWLTVTDDPELAEEEGFCTEENAESWRDYHGIDGIRETKIKRRNHDGTEEERTLKEVLHPDLHSHTWLTGDELGQVIAHWMTTPRDYPYPVEWDACYAAMRALEERGHRTRIIIAFDN
jgi:hypothetical protein